MKLIKIIEFIDDNHIRDEYVKICKKNGIELHKIKNENAKKSFNAISVNDLVKSKYILIQMVNNVEKDFENKKIVKIFKDEKIKNLNKKLKYVERGIEIAGCHVDACLIKGGVKQ